jgi:deoxycytidine triphosphate deaminase
VRVVVARVENPKKPNWKELERRSLEQLLTQNKFEELVELYSLEHLEKHFGIDKILKQFPEVKKDPGGLNGVLSTREIRRYAKEFRLICPFQEENLKGAAYYLSLGEEYVLQGKKGKLQDEAPRNELKIPPFGVAIIKTKEILNLPRFLIGRWNIRVHKAYEGLLWIGGPQIDPGWIGHLFCPIYNLSDQEIILTKGEQIALVDFVRTTDFDETLEDEYKRFPREEAKKKIEDYNWLRSGLYTMAQQKIEELVDKVKRVETLGTIVLAVIAVLIAVLSIFVTSVEKVEVTQPYWIYFSVIVSIIAILVSFRGWPTAWSSMKTGKWFYIAVTIYMFISAIIMGFLAAKVW